MSTLYPGAIDDSTTLPPPGPNTVTNAGSVTHAILHDNEILALQALETKVGTGSSTSTTSTVLRASSNGTSIWGKLVLTSDVTGTLPVANGGTGITSIGTGVAAFLGTPSSANLAASLTDETGSGVLVFGTSPTITTPVIDQFGTASGLGSAWTNYTPTFTGFSVNPTATGTRYYQIGKLVVVTYSCLGGTSNSTSTTVSLPVTASTNGLGSYVRDFSIRAQDNGAIGVNLGVMEFDIGATVASIFKDNSGGAWTATGTKGFRTTIMYEAA